MKTLVNKISDRVGNKYYGEKSNSSFAIEGVDLAEDIDFCVNKCPHPKKSCNGDCKEHTAFVKAIQKT